MKPTYLQSTIDSFEALGSRIEDLNHMLSNPEELARLCPFTHVLIEAEIRALNLLKYIQGEVIKTIPPHEEEQP